MEDEEKATELATMMCKIGKAAGKETMAVISDMNQPLGRAVGNAIEVIEAIDTLKGCLLYTSGCSVALDDDKRVINIRGKLNPGEYRLKGNVSSQFVSGLMMALPILDDESTLIIEKPVISKSYIDMTLNILQDFGISIAKKHESHEIVEYTIMGNQIFRGPGEYKIEGDWSSASFWLIAEKLTGKPLLLQGINTNSIQGDSKVRDFIKQMDAEGDVTIDCTATDVYKRQSLS